MGPDLRRRSRAAYREYYDDTTREAVRGHWSRDIELFGYDFE